MTEHSSLVSDLGPRVSVIGNSGSGKTWIAARIAERLGVPHIEMDALRHGPNWTETPDDEFRRLVGEAASGDGWVIDGNYTEIVRDIIWSRAAGVVWVDYARRVVMRQVIARSVARWVFRQELWNGNRERARDWVRWEHPMRWAWAQHHEKRARDAKMLELPRWAHLRVARLSSPQEARRWLEATSVR